MLRFIQVEKHVKFLNFCRRLIPELSFARTTFWGATLKSIFDWRLHDLRRMLFVALLVPVHNSDSWWCGDRVSNLIWMWEGAQLRHPNGLAAKIVQIIAGYAASVVLFVFFYYRTSASTCVQFLFLMVWLSLVESIIWMWEGAKGLVVKPILILFATQKC